MTSIIERVARAITREGLRMVAFALEGEDSPEMAAAIDTGWRINEGPARAAVRAMLYVDGADEDRLIQAANAERLDAVSLACAWDRVIGAALGEEVRL